VNHLHWGLARPLYQVYTSTVAFNHQKYLVTAASFRHNIIMLLIGPSLRLDAWLQLQNICIQRVRMTVDWLSDANFVSHFVLDALVI
jgi:hypothetical protein